MSSTSLAKFKKLYEAIFKEELTEEEYAKRARWLIDLYTSIYGDKTNYHCQIRNQINQYMKNESQQQLPIFLHWAAGLLGKYAPSQSFMHKVLFFVTSLSPSHGPAFHAEVLRKLLNRDDIPDDFKEEVREVLSTIYQSY